MTSRLKSAASPVSGAKQNVKVKNRVVKILCASFFMRSVSLVEKIEHGFQTLGRPHPINKYQGEDFCGATLWQMALRRGKRVNSSARRRSRSQQFFRARMATYHE